MSAWSNLPNAKHIDAVLESLADYPLTWIWAWHKIKCVAPNYNDVYHAALMANENKLPIIDPLFHTTTNIALDKMHPSSRGDSLRMVRGVLMGLIIYPESAPFLSTKPDDVEFFSKMGIDAATLTLPGSYVLYRNS